MPHTDKTTTGQTALTPAEANRTAWENTGVLHVYAASRPRSIFVVDAAHVTHVPAAGDFAFLHVCPHYEPGGDEKHPLFVDVTTVHCPRGAACEFVHADLTGAKRHTPHTMPAALAGRYDFMPAGHRIAVTMPPGADADAVTAQPFPSESLLVTRGAVAVATTTTTPTVAHQHQEIAACPHFVEKQRCDRGERCRYAHPVAVRALSLWRADEVRCALQNADPALIILTSQHVPSARRGPYRHDPYAACPLLASHRASVDAPLRPRESPFLPSGGMYAEWMSSAAASLLSGDE